MIPEGVGFDKTTNVKHVPAGPSQLDRCVSSSNTALFEYKPPVIETMKADLTKASGEDVKVVLTLRGVGIDDNGKVLIH